MRELLKQKILWIAALGYFIDLFDLVLYGVVRVDSLKSLGYNGSDLFTVGAALLNIQMVGMLLGGFLWGMIGDRRGRKEALFGSILIYSLATFLNAYVHSFAGYAALRFLAGLGLAGELGAAITLVSEALPVSTRGLGSAFVASIGFLGAAVASFVTQSMEWQNAYRLGGILGFALLLTRVSLKESSVYLEAKQNSEHSPTVQWGSIATLFLSKKRLKLFSLALIAGVPIWFVAGVLTYFAPEFGKDLNIQGEISAGTAITLGYLGAIIGDIACGILSQFLKSRKKAVFSFMLIGGSIAVFHPYFIRGASTEVFYLVRFLIGFGNGFFAILIAWIAEIFGTNLRTTVTTTISNLIRASVIPLIFSFQFLKPSLGLAGTAVVVGGVVFGAALFSILQLPETFGRDLRFLD